MLKIADKNIKNDDEISPLLPRQEELDDESSDNDNETETNDDDMKFDDDDVPELMLRKEDSDYDTTTEMEENYQAN